MNSWTERDLEAQFEKAKSLDWLGAFRDAGARYGFDHAILMALGSRETNLHNIIGDGGHGHCLMQIDNRSFPAWCSGGKWKDARECIRMGAYVLSTKRERAINKKVPQSDQLRVAIASYNAGDHAIEDYFKHENPDRRTTGHDYSRDVLKRAEVFKRLLMGSVGANS